LPEGGLLEGGLPEGGLPEGGLLEGGLAEGGLAEGGLPEGGMPEGGLPEGGLPEGGLPWRRVACMKENEVNALKVNGSQLHDEIFDELKLSQVFNLIEPENNNAFSKSEIETQMQRQEEKVNMRDAVDAGLVVTESSGTKPDKQDTSSSSGNYTTQAVDADIRLVNDEEPFAEKQIKSVNEASNEAKVKNDIDVIEKINIELEHSVAKLLAANEQL
ncbi:hypothetical protein Tco_1462918, partial [Tanacetum coccineum]